MSSPRRGDRLVFDEAEEVAAHDGIGDIAEGALSIDGHRAEGAGFPAGGGACRGKRLRELAGQRRAEAGARAQGCHEWLGAVEGVPGDLDLDAQELVGTPALAHGGAVEGDLAELPVVVGEGQGGAVGGEGGHGPELVRPRQGSKEPARIAGGFGDRASEPANAVEWFVQFDPLTQVALAAGEALERQFGCLATPPHAAGEARSPDEPASGVPVLIVLLSLGFGLYAEGRGRVAVEPFTNGIQVGGDELPLSFHNCGGVCHGPCILTGHRGSCVRTPAVNAGAIP